MVFNDPSTPIRAMQGEEKERKKRGKINKMNFHLQLFVKYNRNIYMEFSDPRDSYKIQGINKLLTNFITQPFIHPIARPFVCSFIHSNSFILSFYSPQFILFTNSEFDILLGSMIIKFQFHSTKHKFIAIFCAIISYC